jgi:hypothetical protein
MMRASAGTPRKYTFEGHDSFYVVCGARRLCTEYLLSPG